MHQKDKQRQSYIISNTQKLIKEYKANYQSALELCIQGLKIETSARDLTVASIISPYLLSLPSFVQVLKTETTSKNFEEIITQISLVMSYRHVPKNRMLMRMGDKGNEFFLILHGKVAFMVIKNIKCYLNEEEFISFLLKLRNNNEIELLRVNILNNIKYFDINEDFDNWLRDCIYEYKTNELMNRKYSPELFEQMEKVYSNIDFYHNTSKNQTPKDKMSNLMVNPLLYIKMNSIENCNLDSKNRKLAIISIYQHMNSFVSGQNFGYIALESKNCKRTATVITLEDCDFGILTKDDYQKLIKDVNERARKQIYNLIYSYPLFHSIPKNHFENKYMHMFQYVKYRRGETVMKEGIQAPNLIFLKKGELELNIYKNIIEVNELIITLKKIKRKLQNQTHSLTEPFQLTEHNTSNSNIQLQTQMNNFYEYYEQKENEEFTLNNQFMSNEFKEIISKKMYIKVSIIKDSDILGLFDTVLESKDISLFNCICLSSQGESYQIEMDCIMNIAQKEERVLTEAKRFSIKKITCFIERLNKHKEAVFNKIKECELTNQKLNKELFVNKSKNKNKSNEKNRFIDIERNSQYSQEQLFMKKINAKNNNLSTEKNDIKYNKNQFLQAPISNTNSRFIIKQKRNKNIRLLPAINKEDKIRDYERELCKKMRKLELLQDDSMYNSKLYQKTKMNQSQSEISGLKRNNKLSQSMAIIKQIKEVKTMSNSYSGILSSFVIRNKRNKTRNKKIYNKINNTNIEVSSLYSNNNQDNNKMPTLYKNRIHGNSHTHQANVSIIDCLILDKFNMLYKRGLIKK